MKKNHYKTFKLSMIVLGLMFCFNNCTANFSAHSALRLLTIIDIPSDNNNDNNTVEPIPTPSQEQNQENVNNFSPNERAIANANPQASLNDRTQKTKKKQLIDEGDIVAISGLNFPIAEVAASLNELDKSSGVRVFLTDGPTLESSTVKEVQIPVKWNKNEVQLQLRMGRHIDFNNKYLLVVDKEGVLHSSFSLNNL